MKVTKLQVSVDSELKKLHIKLQQTQNQNSSRLLALGLGIPRRCFCISSFTMRCQKAEPSPSPNIWMILLLVVVVKPTHLLHLKSDTQRHFNARRWIGSPKSQPSVSRVSISSKKESPSSTWCEFLSWFTTSTTDSHELTRPLRPSVDGDSAPLRRFIDLNFALISDMTAVSSSSRCCYMLDNC